VTVGDEIVIVLAGWKTHDFRQSRMSPRPCP
jgi:hypothetical protein